MALHLVLMVNILSSASRKNIQFPYGEYAGHFCVGIIYSRTMSETVNETRIYKLGELQSIVSVIQDFQFFVAEKWEIASDKQGSFNTANIGSITNIDDILKGNGVFKNLGESWFDDYWMNYGKITITTSSGKSKKITSLREFLSYRGHDLSLANPAFNRYARKKR